MNEDLRQAAMSAGRHAGRTGRPVTDCPFPADGTPTEKACAGAWVREYLRQRPDLRATVSLTD